mmetsp:Transcript_41444/g.54532  ORF Transcript_41444/g.54532 Transcript_41444/m.54532 type:complete len:84 (-) Transcript_41444:680-931(-)
MVAETLSDRNKISLMEDATSPRMVNEEDECKELLCLNNDQGLNELNLTKDSQDECSEDEPLSDQVVLNDQQESDDSYDSEDLM